VSGPVTETSGAAAALPLPKTPTETQQAILRVLTRFRDAAGAAWLDLVSLTERCRNAGAILPDLSAVSDGAQRDGMVEVRSAGGLLKFWRVTRYGFRWITNHDANRASAAGFHGPDLEPQDLPRLERQLDIVRNAMRHGKTWTLAELAKLAGCSVASASARIRDLRKLKHGGWVIAKERKAHLPGVFVYRRVCIPAGEEA
jgi:hypothetical protein